MLQFCGLETQAPGACTGIKMRFHLKEAEGDGGLRCKGLLREYVRICEAGKFAGLRFAAFCSAVTVEIQLSKVDAIQ